MDKRIIICGLNGAGKSTCGKLLASELNVPFIDIEDLYFKENRLDTGYAEARTTEEVSAILREKLHALSGFVLAAVQGGYEGCEAYFSCAVLLDVPKAVRLERIRHRSYKKFGSRMEKGGDLYESEERFFAKCTARSDDLSEKWAAETGLPVIHADGTQEPAAVVSDVIARLEALS